jgi:hypothetical protein
MKEITGNLKSIENFEAVKSILDLLPDRVFLLNAERQILYANNREGAGNDSMEVNDIPGLRPGEYLNCIHATKNPDGCGYSQNCKSCKAINTVILSQLTKKEISEEFTLTANLSDKRIREIEFCITSKPFLMDRQEFILLTLRDISPEKHKLGLERIFFHDLYDKVASLHFLLDRISNDNTSEGITKVKLAQNMSLEILEEINSYKEVLQAEKEELRLKYSNQDSYDAIWNVISQIGYHTVAYKKIIEVKENSCRLAFTTDVQVFSRILMNMLKNALEATPSGGKVLVYCETDDNYLRFVVNNKGEMSEEIKSQLFERRFSTKGAHRGLGTYSMKLLGEKYLQGKISYESGADLGTSFIFTLPLIPTEKL